MGRITWPPSKREDFGVELVCRTLGVSASAYYQRRTGKRSKRAVEDERLLEIIRTTHQKNYGAYGYRKMWKTLLRAGESVSRCRVQRLMRQDGLVGAKARGKRWQTTISDPMADRRPDLVCRDFTASAPDRLWIGDFTYLRCLQGRLFFSFVIDVFSRRIVGWQLATHMRTDLVLDALRMALGTRQPGLDLALSSRAPGLPGRENVRLSSENVGYHAHVSGSGGSPIWCSMKGCWQR